MPQRSLPFKRVTTVAEAEEIKALLDSYNITNSFSDDLELIETTIEGGGFIGGIDILVHQDDFSEAQKILEKRAMSLVTIPDEEHYLKEFSVDELYEVLLKSDEWSEYDVALAKKLLQMRGEPVSDSELEKLQQERLKELSFPEQEKTALTAWGYIFLVLEPIASVLIGLLLSTHKKILPNGERPYAFSKELRKEGKTMLYLGITFLVFRIIIASIWAIKTY